MAPDDRRKALVDATRPLLVEHGASVSTRQIAEAAGVAEGTIFRVFASKEDLIHACLMDAISEDALASRLAELPGDADLTDTVAGIAGVLNERIAGIRTMVTLLHDKGRGAFRPDRDAPHHDAHHDQAGPGAAGQDVADQDADEECRRPDPAAIRAAVLDAVEGALSRHAPALRVTPRLAASALVSLTFGATHSFSGGGEMADPAVVARLLLHGIATTTSKDS